MSQTTGIRRRAQLAWLSSLVLVLLLGTRGASGDAGTSEARAKQAEKIYQRIHRQAIEAMIAPPKPLPAGTVLEVLDIERAEQFYLWSRRWMEARRDQAATADGRRAAVRAHRDRMKSLEDGELVKEYVKDLGASAPKYTPEDADEWAKSEFAETIRYFRLEADAWLEKEPK